MIISMAERLFSAKNYISPLSTSMRSDALSTLGSALSIVHSSHEAVFIFDQGKFIGLVSPFKTLYSSNYPYTAKLSSLAFVPPSITEDTPIYEVAEHMVATKIYTLPVFENAGRLQGVISGKDILKKMIKDADIVQFISNAIQPNDPIIVPLSSSVRDVFHELKEKGVSRLVVVDGEGDLAGIVTRRDLMQSLIRPTAKMRFPNEGTQMGYYSLAGEKKFRKEEPIRTYYTALVATLPDTTPMDKIITRLVTSPHNSVILIDTHQKPTGFLSLRDLLQAVAELRPEEEVPLIVRKPSTSVSDQELTRATTYLEQFGRKLKRRMPIEKIEVASEEPKNRKGHTKVFNTTVIVTPVAGKAFVAITKRRKFLDGIQESATVIEKQRRRNGASKGEMQHSAQ
jgi:predicted transcriptional regulator